MFEGINNYKTTCFRYNNVHSWFVSFGVAGNETALNNHRAKKIMMMMNISSSHPITQCRPRPTLLVQK